VVVDELMSCDSWTHILLVSICRDEKTTLLSQISTLQSQDERLQSRLDSISNTADSAYMREREAEDKLDMMMSMHARQLAQRQAREAELERTISDLSANLANSSAAHGGDAEGGNCQSPT
jgi:predicted RNase H-like nuclease (RuvC/YqgF family)